MEKKINKNIKWIVVVMVLVGIIIGVVLINYYKNRSYLSEECRKEIGVANKLNKSLDEFLSQKCKDELRQELIDRIYKKTKESQ